MKIEDFTSFFNTLADPDFPQSGHSVADSDVCVALTCCLRCEGLNIPSLSHVYCGRATGNCPQVFAVAKAVRANLNAD